MLKIKADPEFVNTDGTNKINLETGKAYKHTDFMKMAGDRWGLLAEEERAEYVELARKDKERFDREKMEYEEKGYYGRTGEDD